jgi:exodeoxyribonuclease VII large subunit
MEQAISLTELNQRVSDVVSSTFDTPVWITAEISEGRTAANGHYYLELIEKHPRTGAVTARARAVIWANRWWMLREAFEQETGRQFGAGLKVQVEVLVTMHPAYGFSLDIQDIDPSFTLGDMARRRQEILRRLEEEGIIDLNRELPFPRLPQRIAVISAAGAAGYGDFCHQLSNNEGGYTFYPHLFAATMQGAKTEADIIHALDQIYQHAELFDVVVIIRGGGATADLASFDEYDLAANCAQFPLPIIVGIGHERDTTVLDRVAHTAVKTPTAVAAFLIDRMKVEGDRLNALRDTFRECVEALCRQQAERLRQQAERLYRTRLVLTRQMDLVDRQAERLAVGLRQRLEREAARLRLMEQSVTLADPALILRRGFSITRVDGRAVTSAAAVAPGSHIETQLADGTITSVVSAGKQT